MSVSDADVKKIAKLARLRLGEAELKLYQDQLTKILDAMAGLGKPATPGASPPPARCPARSTSCARTSRAPSRTATRSWPTPRTATARTIK